MNMNDISLLILEDREKRNQRIQELLNSYSVLSIKANFPSLEKNHYLAWTLVNIFEKEIDKLLFNTNLIQSKEMLNGYDGRTILYTIDKQSDPFMIKKACVSLEENHFLGRLIDIDVYDQETKETLSRSKMDGKLRMCLVCGEHPAFVCQRNHSHDVEEIIDTIESMVTQFLTMQVKKFIQYSMMLELNLKYKFGLVTPYHKHPDMDLDLMKKASNVILYPFLEMFEMGFQIDDLKELNEKLHLEGRRAEYLMFKETGGVNAYKGLIFLLGMFLGGLSYSIAHQVGFKETLLLLNKDVLNDYQDESLSTFGAKAYREYGITGARGEAKEGFPHVFQNVELLNLHTDDELYHCLIQLVKDVDDTVLLKRSGSIENYHYYKDLISSVDYQDLEKIQEVTLQCERNNISVGGCADLLVITIFYSLFRRVMNIDE